MNAAIRAVTRAALAQSVAVVGVRRGFEGLLDDQISVLDRAAVVNIIQRGGTVLGTARSERFKTHEGVDKAVGVLAKNGVDGLIVIGGDGTFRGASALIEAGGPPVIGVPGTIDNDVVGADRSIGFDTAVNTALDAIDRIRDTATSHEVLHFVEVMGRHSGWLALAAALAGGAEAVLVPEHPDQLDSLCDDVARAVARGKRSVIVVVAEGDDSGGAAAAAAHLGPRLGLEYRVTVLGHIQRGGAPTAADRILGAALGVAAVDALLNGQRGVMLGEVRGELVQTPLALPSGSHHAPPASLMRLVERLG